MRCLPVLLLGVFLLPMVGCKTQKTVLNKRKTMDPTLQHFAGNFDLVTDENGSTTVQSDRRSTFENLSWRNDKSGPKKKEFQAKEFTGRRSFDAGEYRDLKDFPIKSSRDQGRDAGLSYAANDATRMAREGAVSYPVTDFATSTSRDEGRTYKTGMAREFSGSPSFTNAPVDNVVLPRAGAPGNPTVQDVRSLLGKE